MKIILFGASGMIGQGALREASLDPEVEAILSVSRTPLESLPPKTTELIVKDLADYSEVASRLAGYDACIWCLGVSSNGMSEADYVHITYDFTVAAAKAILEANPKLRRFCFISGGSTDSTEKTGPMWARVKGRAENALLAMPMDTVCFRPGYIQPLHGIKSKTPSYNFLYFFTTPLFPLFFKIWPRKLTTTERLGKALVEVAKHGSEKKVLETVDIADVYDRIK